MNDLFKSVCECLGQCFGVDPSRLGIEDSQDTIAEWDSVGQVELILALEARFDVAFDLEEIVEIKCVGDIVNLVEQKLKAS